MARKALLARKQMLEAWEQFLLSAEQSSKEHLSTSAACPLTSDEHIESCSGVFDSDQVSIWGSAHICVLDQRLKDRRYRNILQELQRAISRIGTSAILCKAFRDSTPEGGPFGGGWPRRNQYEQLVYGCLVLCARLIRCDRTPQNADRLHALAAELIHMNSTSFGPTTAILMSSPDRLRQEPMSSHVATSRPHRCTISRRLSSDSLLEPRTILSTSELQRLIGDVNTSQAFINNIASGHSRQINGNIFNIDIHINQLIIRRRHSEESFVTARTALSAEVVG